MSVKIGDEVLLEECWEDEAGNYHDEYVTVTKIYPDGRCRFRIDGDWKAKQAQYWINKFDYYSKDLEPLAPTQPVDKGNKP